MRHLGKITGAGAIVLGLMPALPAMAEVEIQQLVSPDGKAFWLVEEHSIPIIALDIGFHGGARLDPPGKDGLAKFTMGLLNEGAGDMDSIAFAERAADVSARLGFSAGRDSVSVSARFLTETLDEGVDLLATALTDPRFDPDAVARVRGQMLSGIAQAESDPGSIARKTWFANAFPDHPYGTPPSGMRETVAAIAVDDLRAAKARLMTRTNARIAIVGDIEPARAGKIVDRLMEGLEKGKPITAAPADSVPPPGVTVVQEDVPQSVAVFGTTGIARDDPDFFPAYVMNHILGGGGLSSRLSEEVRKKRGLAYSVYSYLAEMDAAKLHMGGVQSANARIAESLDVIRKEWARIARDGVTAEELEAAKKYLTGSYPLQFDSNTKIANYLVFMQMEGLDADYINRRNDLIRAVTREDVQRAAKRLPGADALSIVVVGKPVGL